jgi:hypothetical protein
MPEPFLHDESGAVRFWVEIDGVAFGASVGKAALHYRFRPGRHDEDPLETYRAHATEIEAAVRRRVASGSIEPVMLREFDLRAPA